MDIKNLEKYKKLKEQLEENSEWPRSYMFKCIAPNAEGKVNRVVALMPPDGKVSFRNTKNLKHVAVTCVATMKSSTEIVAYTERFGEIPGVMVL